MTLSITTVVYIFFSSALWIAIIVDFIREEPGGLWYGGKKNFELGLTGYFILISWIIGSLIFGGIFWW